MKERHMISVAPHRIYSLIEKTETWKRVISSGDLNVIRDEREYLRWTSPVGTPAKIIETGCLMSQIMEAINEFNDTGTLKVKEISQ
jgi:hydroxyethylthiazole kinase-like sugar kinase family protein